MLHLKVIGETANGFTRVLREGTIDSQGRVVLEKPVCDSSGRALIHLVVDQTGELVLNLSHRPSELSQIALALTPMPEDETPKSILVETSKTVVETRYP